MKLTFLQLTPRIKILAKGTKYDFSLTFGRSVYFIHPILDTPNVFVAFCKQKGLDTVIVNNGSFETTKTGERKKEEIIIIKYTFEFQNTYDSSQKI